MVGSELVMAGMVMGGLGIALSAVLAMANSKLHVEEDPRIDQVDALLPHANCGACGMPGCRAFAEATVGGQIAPGKCTVNTASKIEAIASLLGVDAGREEKRVARLACAGGAHVARMQARYAGLSTCRAAALVSGGGKGCAWGCLGLADCQVVCEFGAITMNEFGLPVVDEEKCTACNACVEVCPKGLFSLHPISHRLWVACKNEALGEEAEADCAVACTGCGRCAADAPAGLIAIKHNLAVIDYRNFQTASQKPIQRCPTGAIVWLEEKKGPIKGPDAKKITRRSPLPLGKAG
ncbi:MAG: RnfABCDGE type electron transport complex subunit B [Candidatus Hydrogenedentes bacterium]|nr:RnfABCDGE type electron transport complex subunit B [Candidatus Hydrogenedentota bacterium]